MLKRLSPHDHLCLIYETVEEWRNTIIPFLKIGLERGEKCVYIMNVHTAEQLRSYLKDENIDFYRYENSGQLVLLKDDQAYLKENTFNPDNMISLLKSETEKAISEDYQCLRVTGEMSWVLKRNPGSDKLLEYEAKLNRDFFPQYPCLAICQLLR